MCVGGIYFMSLGRFRTLQGLILIHLSEVMFFVLVWLPSVQYIAPWDFGSSSITSLRNTHACCGGPYVSHRIAMCTGQEEGRCKYGLFSRHIGRSMYGLFSRNYDLFGPFMTS